MFDIKRMTLKEKIGQLLMISVKGRSLRQETKEFIEKFHIGGVILFEENLSNESDAALLCRELRELRRVLPQKTPLFIAVDQEGGRVSRFRNLIPPVPAAGLLGETGSDLVVRSHFKRMARELSLLNMNMNMAPVLDVDTNPKNPVIGDRSFGKDPELVTRLGLEAAQSLRDEGIIPVGKHFPGHGDTSFDSHLTLPVLGHDMKRLKKIELKPFIASINRSIEAIMTAHVLYKGVDPVYPATLSKRIIHDLLRNELGFNGVVISDDLMMKGITERFEVGEAALLAKNAGVDILLICHSRKSQVRVFERLLKSVETKELPMKAIDESLGRVCKLKQKYLKI